MSAVGEVWLTTPQIAKRLGIKPGTWRAYVARGEVPPPDDPDDERPPRQRMPRWREATIQRYEQGRKPKNPPKEPPS